MRDHRSGPVAKLSALSALLLLAATALGHAQNLTPQEQKLVEAAKKEGAVTVLNAIFADRTGQRLGEAFVKRYNLGPNFQFNNLRKGTGQTVAQVRQEIMAGRLTVDILLVSSPGFFSEAHKRGAFEKLDSGHWHAYEDIIKSASQYAEYPYVVTPFGYTFQPVWNASCPGMEKFTVNSYPEAVAPALKGKTIASDLTKSLTYTNTSISLKENGLLDLKEYWPKLKATDPIVEFRTEPKMQMVIACQRPFDMWNLSGRVYQNVLKEPKLAEALKIGTYKEGQVMLGNQAAVLKGAPHTNAGKLFIDFMLSKEGMDVIVEGEALNSFRKDYEPPPAAKPYLFDVTKVKLLGLKDWVAASSQFKPVREEWASVFR
jgi:iron(III) transport system substrate-binding protein